MLLFSSFNHFYILLMFLYLGLLSGFIFFLVYLSTNKLKSFNFKVDKGDIVFKKKTQKKLVIENKGNVVVSKPIQQKDLKIKKIKNKEKTKRTKKRQKNKKPPDRNVIKKINNLTKRFLTFKIFFKRLFRLLKNFFIFFFNKFKNIILNIVNIAVLSLTVVVSYSVNVIYNMGHLRVIYVIVWLSAFILSSSLVKKVAKIIFNFYNKLKQKYNANKKLQSNKEKTIA